jgi:hypothetical protein
MMNEMLKLRIANFHFRAAPFHTSISFKPANFMPHCPPATRNIPNACKLKRLVLFSCALLLVAIPQAWAAAQTSTQEAQHIAGVVLDQADAPVAGAAVSLMSGASELAETMTDEAGKFSFARVVSREATLIVRARGFQTLEQKWNGEKTEASNLRLVLAPAPFSEEMTVTATRTETRLNDTAASVVTLSSAELEMTAAVTLDDALRQVAGFQLFRRAGSRTANPTTQGVSLRATGASGASRALVLADGIPLNDPFGGWINWGRVPRESVSRVEVLRGGFSHLYGSGALGGVVNILTRRAAAPVVALEASYGSSARQTLRCSSVAGTDAGARRSPPKPFALKATSSLTKTNEAAQTHAPDRAALRLISCSIMSATTMRVCSSALLTSASRAPTGRHSKRIGHTFDSGARAAIGRARRSAASMCALMAARKFTIKTSPPWPPTETAKRSRACNASLHSSSDCPRNGREVSRRGTRWSPDSTRVRCAARATRSFSRKDAPRVSSARADASAPPESSPKRSRNSLRA